MNSKDFQASLKSDPMTFTEQAKANDRRFQLAQQMRAKLKYGNVEVAAGIFGEWKGCDGYVEEIIRPKEGGVFMKLYGCHYLFKGYPKVERIRALELPKMLISRFPRDIIAKSWLFSGSLALMFLFARKRFIKYATVFFEEVNDRIKWFEIPPEEYSPAVKEFKRATFETLKSIHNGWTLLVAHIARFLFLFIDQDAAYRFRLQDGFDDVDPTKDGISEFYRCLDKMISREIRPGESEFGSGIAHKWKFIKRLLKIILFLCPGLKVIVREAVQNLDSSKIKMDEADWFFCLRYVSYNYKGWTKDQRFAERDRLDALHENIYLL